MLPKRLKELRLEAGLTQKELALAINTSQQNIGFYELGKRNPKKEILDNLSDFFNVSTNYLLGKTDIKNSSEIDEEKLDRAIDESLGFNGKPATEQERENMKEALRIYLESLNEQ